MQTTASTFGRSVRASVSPDFLFLLYPSDLTSSGTSVPPARTNCIIVAFFVCSSFVAVKVFYLCTVYGLVLGLEKDGYQNGSDVCV